MPVIPLDDLDDPRLAIYRNLKATNETRGLPLFVVEGEKLVLSLRDSRYPIESVLLSDHHADRIAPSLPGDVTAFVVEHARISTLVGYNFHQGALAAGRRLPPIDPGSLVETRPGMVTLVACPVVQNPENLGTIVRTADVFGVDAVLVGPTCPDPLSRRVLRVSMGTVLGLPVIPCDDLAARLDRLRSDLGLRLVATVTDPHATPIDRFERPERLAIVMGSEAHGLAPSWVDRCDHRVTIPMRPGAESLNVAVAAGIFLHRLAVPRR
ncbi:TrmH family RNA methyltransferase [Tautonia plasticadhaerens]|uniref:TrmH family tRNA/rRNA methyltransferase n=1 Tax=Tautonia plasticadhaerens TaxID=2527974 RepID=A0A518HAZ8_9BACT|nr:RNA methyltransferase [Tautonia plasticadhaerens]QDV37987.1 Putative TrmH family tRNA/rRNA methyltransferase [Tautonia plasticadhaerens]